MIIVEGELFLTKEEDIINQKIHWIDTIIQKITDYRFWYVVENFKQELINELKYKQKLIQLFVSFVANFKVT